MQTLLQQYREIRAHSESLCSALSVEDYNLQAVAFTSPVKWHLAHTSWFFEEMILANHDKHYKKFNANYSFLFNSYYNAVGQRLNRDQRGLISRPDVSEILAYRKHIDSQIARLLTNQADKNITELIILGLQHEQQHQELLITDLKYNFSLNPTYPVYRDKNFISHKSTAKKKWISINEGIYEIGYAGQSFSFDNERSKHRIFLEPYSIAQQLVSYGDFIQFIDDNAYDTPHLWLDDGWSWIKENHISHPLYWHKINNEWWHYTLSGLQKINPEETLSHISYYEAQAFAHYKGARLPTEFEWEVASSFFEWGNRWEWTNSAYLPYPGFKISDGAVGEYNGKFMSNQMVLRGASTATSLNHSRNTYRNFFRPETQWQFSGIRLAK